MLAFNPQTIPLSLYIHIPWCVKKCPYCDFNSHESKQAIDFDGYVIALLNDLASQANFVQGREIASIFIGGGTPSLMPIASFQRLFAGIKQQLSLAKNCEITMEANPATIEHAPFADYLAVGINRLSLGVQSFHEVQLQALGRIHTPSQALSAINNATKAGFTHLNADIMHGLPQQTLSEAMADLQQLIDLNVAHISWYQLTIEPNTVFFRNTPILPDEDVLADIFECGNALLRESGYQQYEVSAWTKISPDFPLGQPSQHNLNYWQFGDYLAIGAGAHGKVSLNKAENNQGENGIFRFSKSRLPKDYLQNQSAKNWQKIPDDELPFEFMMNALRLKQGVPKNLWQRRTGLDWQVIEPTLLKLQSQGLIEWDDDRVKCSEQGYLFLNQVLQAFLPEVITPKVVKTLVKDPTPPKAVITTPSKSPHYVYVLDQIIESTVVNN